MKNPTGSSLFKVSGSSLQQVSWFVDSIINLVQPCVVFNKVDSSGAVQCESNFSKSEGQCGKTVP